MSKVIDERNLSGGYKIELYHDARVRNPRHYPHANLGHVYTWSRNIASPDKNPYGSEIDFVRCMLRDKFTVEEMVDAVKEGMSSRLRFEGRLKADYTRGLVAADCMASCIALCRDAPKLVSRKFMLLPVYGLGGLDYTLSIHPIGVPIGCIWADLDELRESLEAAEPPFPSAQEREESLRKRARAAFACEVEEYSSWLNGYVYEARLVHGEDVIDSVEGVYDFDLGEVIEQLEAKAKRRQCS